MSERALSVKVAENFNGRYALKLKDIFNYEDVLGSRAKNPPADLVGRGLINNGGIHEFQTVSLVEDDTKQSDYVIKFIEGIQEKNKGKVKKIPTLPE